jgi:cyclophilin family peptidyl-prolyl cis-trans isomerase
VIRSSIPRLAAQTLLLSLAFVATACAGSTGSSEAPAATPLPSAVGLTCPTTQPDPLPAGETRQVTLDTDKGQIAILVEADLSPIAAGNFVALASCGFYDGTVFHRTAALEDGTPFVIQGGAGPDGLPYTIEDEPVTAAYKRGTVAMARTADPNSVTSQFFIVLDDGAADVLAFYNTYQIIGEVTAGMETADAIFAASGGAESPPNPVPIDSATVTTP